ncbi:hypothetical protein E4U55_001258 [Claviceps digitariae]|nr:hypothetical protein E4U55_001258 [Claviceps digitariae]
MFACFQKRSTSVGRRKAREDLNDMVLGCDTTTAQLPTDLLAVGLALDDVSQYFADLTVEA